MEEESWKRKHEGGIMEEGRQELPGGTQGTRRHLGGTHEVPQGTSRHAGGSQHPGATQQTPRRHPRDAQDAPSGHPAGTQDTQGSRGPRPPREANSHRPQPKTKFLLLINFTTRY